VSDTIAAVASSVGAAERRVEAVDGSVRALEQRNTQFDGLEDRIRCLGEEIEQRQGALDKATEHLTRASALRQESAETAQRLEELTRKITGMVQKADAQATGLERLSGELEKRADALKPIERQQSLELAQLTRASSRDCWRSGSRPRPRPRAAWSRP
jgi:DNA repair exonuclease SbcCD ATPase subunit